MSRRAQADVFGDTQPPHEVRVRCDACGKQFTTDEDTALEADRQGTDLRCSQCEDGRRQAPPQAAFENPTVDAVHDNLHGEVGPDAEPDVEAILGSHIGFGELTDFDHIKMGLRRGTESLGSISVRLGDVDGLSLPVRLNPSPEALDDEAVEAIVSTLSRHTQLLIDLEIH